MHSVEQFGKHLPMQQTPRTSSLPKRHITLLSNVTLSESNKEYNIHFILGSYLSKNIYCKREINYSSYQKSKLYSSIKQPKENTIDNFEKSLFGFHLMCCLLVLAKLTSLPI